MEFELRLIASMPCRGIPTWGVVQLAVRHRVVRHEVVLVLVRRRRRRDRRRRVGTGDGAGLWQRRRRWARQARGGPVGTDVGRAVGTADGGGLMMP